MQKRIYAAGAKAERLSLIVEILVCTLLTAGITGILCAFTSSVAANIFILIESAVMSAVIALVRKKPTVSHIFHAAAVIVFALIIILGFHSVQNAMLGSVNSAIDNFNRAFGKDIALLGAESASVGAQIAFFGVMTAVIAMLISFLVSKRAVMVLTVLTFALLIIEMTLKLPFGAVLVIVIFIGLIGCWSLCVSGGGRNMIFIGAGMTVVAVIASIIVGATGFNGFKVLGDLHEDVSDRIYSIRYGDDSLPHGQLSKASDMLNSSDETLTVSFDEPEVLYLKGFTGSSFENNEWQEYNSESYLGEWNGMLHYFEENKFSVQNMFADYSKAGNNSIEYNYVSVTNNGADRSYVYLPFTAAEADGSKNYRDLCTRSGRLFGAKSYSFKNVKTDKKPEQLNPSSWINGRGEISEEQKDYIEKENVYRAFVRDTYLEIDDLTRAEVNEVFFKNIDAQSDDVGVYTITSRIRSILSLITEYTQNPVKPEDKDFIGWFLGSYKKGNSPYYATAAVMAYRAAGIPARYAEGYYISQSDVSNLSASGLKKIQLTGKNAHAWVEIYRDGIGWVSMEVTPGFYSETLNTEEIIDISKNIGDVGNVNGRGSEHYTNQLSMYSPEKADDSDRMSSGVRILFTIILLLIIFIMLMHIRYIWLTYKKYDKTYGQTKPDTTSCMMGYICAALTADGIKANPDNPNAFREPLLKKYPEFLPQEFDRVITLLRRSSYGGARLREHELRTIRIFMEKLYKCVYTDKTLLQKFVMKYIKII
ncbi:MAG: transglutaminase domain-containing protein [bacterium]|nr:transglutaminase domain-containing protein [bacterium]